MGLKREHLPMAFSAASQDTSSDNLASGAWRAHGPDNCLTSIQGGHSHCLSLGTYTPGASDEPNARI